MHGVQEVARSSRVTPTIFCLTLMKLIKTTTEDGLNLTGILSEADSIGKIIIHIHGMSGDIYTNSYYPAMYENYPNNGISFLAVETRGTHSVTQFNSSDGIKNIGNAYEIFEDCVFDINAWVNKAQELGYSEIWLQGHSLGTSKLAHYIDIAKGSSIRGLILLSPSDMIGLVHTPQSTKETHELLLNEATELVQKREGDQILSNDLWEDTKLSAKTYLNFFGSESNLAVFNFDNESLGWEKVNNIGVPVIVFTGTDDFGVISTSDPYEAMQKLEVELRNSPKVKTVVYEGADHDFKGFGKEIVEEVVSFL